VAKPGRRISTPAQYRRETIARTRASREAAGLSHAAIATRLSKLVGRPIAADSYRKWEKTALLPHDLVIPFCNITGTDPYFLLTGVPFTLGRSVAIAERPA
jgi:hypothetical protein